MDTGQEGGRKRTDAGQEGYRTGGMQERRDEGKEGCRDAGKKQ